MTVRESSREREKMLKAKYREATEERDRLASIEVWFRAILMVSKLTMIS